MLCLPKILEALAERSFECWELILHSDGSMLRGCISLLQSGKIILALFTRDGFSWSDMDSSACPEWPVWLNLLYMLRCYPSFCSCQGHCILAGYWPLLRLMKSSVIVRNGPFILFWCLQRLLVACMCHSNYSQEDWYKPHEGSWWSMQFCHRTKSKRELFQS